MNTPDADTAEHEVTAHIASTPQSDGMPLTALSLHRPSKAERRMAKAKRKRWSSKIERRLMKARSSE